jgi:multiple sugar transport system permease protein
MMLNPTLLTLQYSLSKVELPQFKTQFSGIKNFVTFLTQSDLGNVITNTIMWTFWTVVLRFGLGLWAALVVNTSMRGMRIWQTILLVPWTIPSIVAANIWRWMLQGDFGLVSTTLQSWGLGFLVKVWLADPATAMPSVIVAYAWAGFPFVMLMLLAGMKGIPDELYDAGKIDGCDTFQLFRHITLPGLRSVIVVVLLLEMINGLNSFDLLFVMTGGGPGGASEVLGLMIYRLGFNNFDFGTASAASVVLMAIVVSGFLVYVPAAARRRGGS